MHQDTRDTTSRGGQGDGLNIASATTRSVAHSLHHASLAVVGNYFDQKLAALRDIHCAALDLANVTNTVSQILEKQLAASLTDKQCEILTPNCVNLVACAKICKLLLAKEGTAISGPEIIQDILAKLPYLQRPEVSSALASLVAKSLVIRTQDPKNCSANLYSLNKDHKALALDLARLISS